ncbi:zona pellucida sperm-binding protein 3-like [Podarcis muralis]
MWYSKGFGCLLLCCVIERVACATIGASSRHKPVTGQLQNGASEESSRQADVPSPTQPLTLLPTSSLRPVWVQCHEDEMVIAVHRDLFGTGQLIQAVDLHLGLQGCRYTSAGVSDLVVFEVGLQECGINLQTTADSLFYHTRLYYNPSSASSPGIVRNSSVEIPIECHYPREDKVSSNGTKPTGVPFTSTKSVEGGFRFSLRLMTDDWSAERESTRYWLGDYLHIQADVEREGDHLPLRLLVDSCVAKQTPEEDASLQYAILDFHGCLVDGRIPDVKSAFKIPRPRLETLQFTIEAFRFSGDIRNLIYIACHLRVVATDKGPDPLNKACSFNSQRSLWLPVEGSEDICNCCETGNCVSSKGWPSTNNPSNRRTSEQREQVTSGSAIIGISEGEAEADLLVGPLLILDSPWDLQRGEVEKTDLGAQGESHVIEAEADSTVGRQFILKADEGLGWLLDSDKAVTTTDDAPHTKSENVVVAKLTSATDESLRELAPSVEITKLSLQGTASQKGTVLERIQTTAAAIVVLALLSCIF